jgi:hypothetical protein
MDRRSKWEIWTDAACRYAMASTLSSTLPIFVVCEYPKSGGTWVGQMLSDYLSLPFPRNTWPPLRSAVHHAHYLYSPMLRNAVCVMRDGRDIMVSYYFHMLFENDKSSPILVRETRDALRFDDYEDVRQNIAQFIEYLFDKQSNSISPFQFTWPQFVRSWNARPAPVVRYEDLVSDCVASMSRMLHQLTGKQPDEDKLRRIADKYSFAAQAQRPAGVEERGSFLRKGRPGDWREKFSPSAARLFSELAGEELILLGYESDNSWVDAVA